MSTTRLTPEDLGRVGIWSRELRFHPDRAAVADAAAELEDLGYATLWIPDVGGDVLAVVEELLTATRSVALATGILNIWMHDATQVAADHARIARRPGNRSFALGLGASHAPVVDAETPGRYAKPLSAMRSYLDALDAADPALPSSGRLLAALGPKMLALAGERAAGAHPYLVPVEHTRRARAILGEGRVLAPEQSVLWEPDRARGLAAARAYVSDYLTLPNYTNNLLRLGYTEDDFVGGGSDRLVEALVAFGDEAVVAQRVSEHLEAGADHVCIAIIGADDAVLPREQWRRLGPALVEL